LELPIDHFRLLGVGPTTDSQSVLRTLLQRLDRLPYAGFTPDTLLAREELLRSSADLLSDPERRLAYESDLTAITSGAGQAIAALDVPSSKEVGGLLLLLEAGQALEALELASRALQPPQAPALGSSREADLTLLAGLAALAAAADLHQQRRYESAAQTLKQGQQLLQRMGQQGELRQQISQELDGLVPFRVLDLLSRNLTATVERAEGVALLQELVQRRGGLEGTADPSLPREEFDAFFKQIRAFLTVQEQVDLFSRWASGSQAADALATTALTASGFAQRKPDRIAAAKERLEAARKAKDNASANPEGHPVLAYLHLLLGEVDQAQEAFASGASAERKQWAAKQSRDPLAQICASCGDWLGREVLPGYRDLEADPNLEAYFADRDVQAYIEAHDPQRAPQPTTPGFISSFPNPFAQPLVPKAETSAASDDPDGDDDADIDGDEEAWLDSWAPRWRLPELPWTDWRWRDLHWPDLHWPDWQWPELAWPGGAAINRQKLGWGTAGVAVLAVAVAVGAGLRSKPRPSAAPSQAQLSQPAPAKPPLPAAPAPAPDVPLTADEPNDAQLKALLEAWLNAKAAVLAGKTSTLPLAALARPQLVETLETDRNADQSRGESQTITAQIQSLVIEERSPSRIAAHVNLDYSETHLGADGTPTGPATKLQLDNRYVFARDGDTWRLASFQRAAN
jgi:hypothetical protein